MAHQVTTQLEQTGPFGREQEIQLLDNRALRVREKQKNRTREYSIDLLALKTRSQRRICLSWPWLISSLISLSATLFLLWWLPRNLPGQANGYLLLTLVLGSLLITGQLYLFWLHSCRKQYFLSRHAGIPLIELQVNQPSNSEFTKFVKHLEQCIARLGQDIELSTQQQLSGEMRMLRRLSKNRVISRDKYQRAKDRLFGHFGQQSTSDSLSQPRLPEASDA